MPLDRFYIGPIDQGQQTDVRPYLIPDQAFASLNNAYAFRGRIRKRVGSDFLNTTIDSPYQQLNSRLRIALAGGPLIGITDAGGNAVGVVPGAIFKVGQLFSIGTQIFTVVTAGVAQPMLNTGLGAATYSTTNGAYTFNGVTPLTQIYFYPAEPVMGFAQFETFQINDERSFAFDTQFAYQFITGGWERLGTAVWTGTDSQFFWSTNYHGQTNNENFLFVSNNNPADAIKFWDDVAGTWTTITPTIDSAGNTLLTGRILLPFKNRLIALNTTESIAAVTTNFPNRCRFSQNGNPVEVLAAPVVTVAWNESIPGRGGYEDAPTTEQIITAQFVKDRLIVYFEASTYELVYTGADFRPFIWQKLNTELGAESTFSQVPFDKVVVGVGNLGIQACNGSNVERIDDKIPDTVFEINNENDGPKRVCGIRDYFLEYIYWAFPSSTNNPVYPDRMLLYNYRTGTWAFNDDSITAFGYFQPDNNLTWGSATSQWQEVTDPWNSATLDAQFPNILAGNQEGYTFVLRDSTTRNVGALQITNIVLGVITHTLTIINHNLQTDDYILIEFVTGSGDMTLFNGRIYPVIRTGVNTVTIEDYTIAVGTYTGGGSAARVSRIDIRTKQYNLYAKEGRNCCIPKIDYMVDRTTNGEISIDYFTSSSDLSLVTDGIASGAIVGTSVLETSPNTALYPLEAQQARLWHRTYLQADGEYIQLRIYLSDAEMVLPNIAFSDFELHAFVIHAQRSSNNLQ